MVFIKRMIAGKRFVPLFVFFSVFLGSCFLEQYNPDRSVVINVKFPYSPQYFSKALLKPQGAGVTYVPSFVDRIQMTLTPRNGDPITICRTKEAVDGCSLVSSLSNQFDFGSLPFDFYDLNVSAYTYNSRNASGNQWIKTHSGTFLSIPVGGLFEGLEIDAGLAVENEGELEGLALDDEPQILTTDISRTTAEDPMLFTEEVLNPAGHTHADYCLAVDSDGNIAVVWLSGDNFTTSYYDSHGDEITLADPIINEDNAFYKSISSSCRFIGSKLLVPYSSFSSVYSKYYSYILTHDYRDQTSGRRLIEDESFLPQIDTDGEYVSVEYSRYGSFLPSLSGNYYFLKMYDDSLDKSSQPGLLKFYGDLYLDRGIKIINEAKLFTFGLAFGKFYYGKVFSWSESFSDISTLDMTGNWVDISTSLYYGVINTEDVMGAGSSSVVFVPKAIKEEYPNGSIPPIMFIHEIKTSYPDYVIIAGMLNEDLSGIGNHGFMFSPDLTNPKTHPMAINPRSDNAVIVWADARGVVSVSEFRVWYSKITRETYIPRYEQFLVFPESVENVGSPKIASNDDGLTVITGVDPTGRIYIKRYLF